MRALDSVLSKLEGECGQGDQAKVGSDPLQLAFCSSSICLKQSSCIESKESSGITSMLCTHQSPPPHTILQTSLSPGLQLWVSTQVGRTAHPRPWEW